MKCGHMATTPKQKPNHCNRKLPTEAGLPSLGQEKRCRQLVSFKKNEIGHYKGGTKIQNYYYINILNCLVNVVLHETSWVMEARWLECSWSVDHYVPPYSSQLVQYFVTQHEMSQGFSIVILFRPHLVTFSYSPLTLKGRKFNGLERVIGKSTEQIQGQLRKASFRNCFLEWAGRWSHCVVSRTECCASKETSTITLSINCGRISL